jgi:hypothetical protein
MNAVNQKVNRGMKTVALASTAVVAAAFVSFLATRQQRQKCENHGRITREGAGIGLKRGLGRTVARKSLEGPAPLSRTAGA